MSPTKKFHVDSEKISIKYSSEEADSSSEKLIPDEHSYSDNQQGSDVRTESSSNDSDDFRNSSQTFSEEKSNTNSR